jgi:hypothetical protein
MSTLPPVDDYGQVLMRELHVQSLVSARPDAADTTDRPITFTASLSGAAHAQSVKMSSVNDRGDFVAQSTYHPELGSVDGPLVVRARTSNVAASPNTTSSVALRVDRTVDDQFNGTEVLLRNGNMILSHVTTVDPAHPYVPSGPYTSYGQSNKGVNVSGVASLQTCNYADINQHFNIKHLVSGAGTHYLQIDGNSGPVAVFY